MYVYACKCVFYGLQILKVGILSRFQGSLLQLHFVDSYKVTLKKVYLTNLFENKKEQHTKTIEKLFRFQKAVRVLENTSSSLIFIKSWNLLVCWHWYPSFKCHRKFSIRQILAPGKSINDILYSEIWLITNPIDIIFWKEIV